jgi:predicted Ser/Thr protein kinase
MTGAGEDRLGPYRLVHQLGEGGMGVVHLALDPSGRAVAIKVLRAHIAHDRDARTRLAREVQTLARVQDARVAAVLDADTDGDRPYIVTRYVPGPPLDQVVADTGPLRGDALLRLGRGLSGALTAIHRAGVVHRDLKPANVLLLDGDPVVIDFGIAHVADDIRLTMTGLVMGTPGYLSPEVVEGAPVTTATDWWGWAATLAFAASGQPPFGRGPMDVVLDRVRRGQADLSGVDPRLAPVLAAALSPQSAGRPHADEIVAALDRYAAGAPATVTAPAAEPTEVVAPGRTKILAPYDARRPGQSAAAASTPAASTPAASSPAASSPAVPFPATPAGAANPPRQVSPGPIALPVDDDPWLPGGTPSRDLDADGEEPDWEAARHGGPGQPDPRIGRPPRSGTLLAITTALVGLAAVWPVVAAAVLVLLCWVARFTDRSVTSLVVRRYAAGRRRSDVPVAVAASPWHLVSSAVATLVALLLPAVVAVAATFSAALVVVSVTGGSPRPDASAPLAAGALMGVLTAWWGPGGASLRRGARSLVRGAVRSRSATEVVVTGLVLAAAGLGIWAWMRAGVPSWWPGSSAQLPFPWLRNR